jgi:hypothetical protein
MAALTVYELSRAAGGIRSSGRSSQSPVAAAQPPPAFIAPPPEASARSTTGPCSSPRENRWLCRPTRRPPPPPRRRRCPAWRWWASSWTGRTAWRWSSWPAPRSPRPWRWAHPSAGWQITSIAPDKIVLHAGTFEQDVRLDAKPAGRRPPAAAARQSPIVKAPSLRYKGASRITSMCWLGFGMKSRNAGKLGAFGRLRAIVLAGLAALPRPAPMPRPPANPRPPARSSRQRPVHGQSAP